MFTDSDTNIVEVHMYVFMYICRPNVYRYVCVCVHAHMCMHVHRCMFACVCMDAHTCMCVCVRMRVCVHSRMCICMYRFHSITTIFWFSMLFFSIHPQFFYTYIIYWYNTYTYWYNTYRYNNTSLQTNFFPQWVSDGSLLSSSSPEINWCDKNVSFSLNSLCVPFLFQSCSST